MISRKRVLVTGGAGFLGSHLCERLLAGRARSAVRRQLLHRLARQHRASARRPALRADAPRRDLPALRRGRRDLQPRLPGLADPLPVRPGADDQDQRARRDQHARPRQADASARSSRPRPARSTATRRCIRSPRATGGSVNPIGPRACYDEGKRCAETLFFDYHRQHGVDIRVARIFNTYGPRMHPNDGRVVSNFIVQALRGEPITVYGDGSQTRSFCYVDDLIEGFVRLMAAPDDVTGPINLGNPGEFTIRELAEMVIELTGSRSRSSTARCPQDDPMQRRPDISLAQSHLGGSRAFRFATAWRGPSRTSRRVSTAAARLASRPRPAAPPRAAVRRPDCAGGREERARSEQAPGRAPVPARALWQRWCAAAGVRPRRPADAERGPRRCDGP